MNQLKIYHPWIALCLLTLMAYACTGKIEKPQTHEEQLAAIEVTITGAYKSVEQLALSGAIKLEQYDNIMAKLNNAEDALNLAKLALVDNDMSTMQTRLQTLTRILTEAQTLLLEAGQ